MSDRFYENNKQKTAVKKEIVQVKKRNKKVGVAMKIRHIKLVRRSADHPLTLRGVYFTACRLA